MHYAYRLHASQLLSGSGAFSLLLLSSFQVKKMQMLSQILSQGNLTGRCNTSAARRVAILMKWSQDWLTMVILDYKMTKEKPKIHLPSLLVYRSVVSTPILRTEKPGATQAGDVSGHRRRGIWTEISDNFGSIFISWIRPVPNSKINPVLCSIFDFTHADFNKKCFSWDMNDFKPKVGLRDKHRLNRLKLKCPLANKQLCNLYL